MKNKFKKNAKKITKILKVINKLKKDIINIPYNEMPICEKITNLIEKEDYYERVKI